MSGTRGGYTFHQRYEHNDINLAHRFEKTVWEQRNDPLFRYIWESYEKHNQRAKSAYQRRMDQINNQKVDEYGYVIFANRVQPNAA